MHLIMGSLGAECDRSPLIRDGVAIVSHLAGRIALAVRSVGPPHANPCVTR